MICALCVGLGLASAQVQSQNHARAARLDELKRKCDLIEASNEILRFQIQMRFAELEREVFVPGNGELAPEELPER